ncbi:MAG: tetratricopeptide repeat protein [Flavobacteriales bacterium]
MCSNNIKSGRINWCRLVLTLLLLLSGSVRAVNLDSLLQEGSNKKNTLSKRSEALLTWSRNSGDTTAVGENYLIEAEKLARKAKNNKLLSEVLEQSYHFYKFKGEMIKAFKKSLDQNDLATRTLDTILLAKAYWLQGLLYLDIEVMPLAIESEKKALHFYKALKDTFGIAYHSYLVGWYSFNNGQYKQSLDYFLLSYEWHKKNKSDDAGMCEITGWIGNAYSGLYEYRDAFGYRFRSLAHALKTKDGYYIGEANRYLGNIHRKLGNIDSTVYYHKIALESYNKTGFISRQGLMMVELATSYYELKDYAEAEKWMNLINDNLTRYDLFVIQLFEKLSGDVYAKSGNPKKALEFFIRYMNRRDSLEETMQRNDIILGNVKFQFESELEKLGEAKRKHDIELVHKQNVRNTRVLLIVIVSVLILLFGFYMRWSGRKRKALLKRISELENG